MLYGLSYHLKYGPTYIWILIKKQAEMKIGIHTNENSFSERWIEYCEKNLISWKAVDCYKNDIIEQLKDCDALMWHINQGNPKDIVFAKQLIFSVLTSGKKVFPNFSTSWHFDDKVGQKYLFESIEAPLVPTWVFYKKEDALAWINHTTFPKVFKLRGGAGSKNVRLVHTRQQAIHLTRKAFIGGFSNYYAWGNLKERWRKYKLGKTNLVGLLSGIIRFVFPPPYARIGRKEKGYIYFQDFIPGNAFDIRVIVIGDKAFAIKRMVRKNDFRASGSGMIFYEKKHFREDTVQLAFKLADKIKSQCAAFDFVYSESKTYIVEVSFGFIKEGYDPCAGYWDASLNWYEGPFNPYGWMVENLIHEITGK